VSAEEPPAQVTTKDIEACVGSTWYGVYCLDRKCGHARLFVEELDDEGGPGYRVGHEMEYVQRGEDGETEVHHREEEIFCREPPWRLRRILREHREGEHSRRTEATVDGKLLVITTQDSLATPERHTMPAPDYTMVDAVRRQLLILGGPELEDEAAYQRIDLQERRVDREIASIARIREVDNGGTRSRVYDVWVQPEGAMVPSRRLVDARGRLLWTYLGSSRELRREAENLARRRDHDSDLILEGDFIEDLVRIDRPLGDPTRVRALEIRVLQTAPGATEGLQSGPGQTVVHDVEAGVAIVRVGPSALPVAVTPRDRRRYLRATPRYPCRHPEIQALARQAGAEGAPDREKVDGLIRLVRKHVSYDLVPISENALEVLRCRRGRCTMQAMLFVSLARALGIPCRSVYGLVYAGDGLRAFSRHAWCEVALQGVWVAVDPTWNQTAVDATHIRVGEGAEAAATGGRTYPYLRFELIKVTYRQ
jgi:hypothetical protein